MVGNACLLPVFVLQGREFLFTYFCEGANYDFCGGLISLLWVGISRICVFFGVCGGIVDACTMIG